MESADININIYYMAFLALEKNCFQISVCGRKRFMFTEQRKPRPCDRNQKGQ